LWLFNDSNKPIPQQIRASSLVLLVGITMIMIGKTVRKVWLHDRRESHRSLVALSSTSAAIGAGRFGKRPELGA
jgi:hypothetical protein